LIILSISIPIAFAEEKISVKILSVEPVRADQWTISWDACSLVEKVGQDWKITSDLGWESFHVDFILYRNQCMTDILGHPVLTVIDAKDPESISISIHEPNPLTNEEKIVVTDILSSKLEGKYIAFFDVCAGEKRLVAPEIVVYSDIDERQAPIGSVIGINSCLGHSAEIYADDIDSIRVKFVSIANVSDDLSPPEIAKLEGKLREQKQEISKLNDEIKDLKVTLAEKDDTIKKKDAVLMEQIKVIQDLATKLTKTIFEPIPKFFGLA